MNLFVTLPAVTGSLFSNLHRFCLLSAPNLITIDEIFLTKTSTAIVLIYISVESNINRKLQKGYYNPLYHWMWLQA